jgi:plastocyanin/sugar lactone lactonase YvrE
VNAITTVLSHSILALALLAGLVQPACAQHEHSAPLHRAGATRVEVYAEGFYNPKGMAFTADGTLYVAESGKPGSVMVPLPVNFGGKGPIGRNARISRVRPGGKREDFVTGLPNIGLYGGVEMLGAAGLAVLNDQLYEVSAGHMTVSPLLSQIDRDGILKTVADIGAFNRTKPPPSSNGDAVPAGNPFDLVALGGDLYITDGNFNRVIKATRDGKLRVLAQWEESPVTVGAAAGPDGNLYVCQFGPAPYYRGSGRIDRVSPDGTITEDVVSDLTTPIDVAFAPDGTMYVLQFASSFSPEKLRYVPFGGTVLRIGLKEEATPVVTNLVFPTALTFGPDGALYVTNYGNEANNGQGQVLRVVPGSEPAAAPKVPPPDESRSYTNTQRPPPPLLPKGTVIAGCVTFVEGQEATKWGYDPAVITIQAGQAITFLNGGQMAHSATHTRGAFDTGMLPKGESVTIRIDDPGTYDYFCHPHPWMKGRVIVEGQARPKEAYGPVEGAGEAERPPTVSPWKAGGFVAVLLVAVLAASYAMRRRPTVRASPPTAE